MSFEMRSAELLTLALTKRALAKIMSCTGEVRPLSFEFGESLSEVSHPHLHRTINAKVKLRNPWGHRTNSADVICSLRRLRDAAGCEMHESDGPWELLQLFIKVHGSDGPVTSRDFHEKDFPDFCDFN